MKKSMKKIMMFMVCLVALCFCKSVKANAQVMISSGYYHTAMIKNDGSLWMCGQNQSGQLGDGTTTNTSKWKKVMTGVRYVSAGGWHTAIIKNDDSLWTWGYNEYGEIGNNTTTACYAPQKIMTGVSSVSLRGWHTVVMKKNGSLQTWGNNEYGQLGDGTTTNRLVPTKEVFYFVKAQQISASSRTVSNKTKSFSLNAKTNGKGKLSYSSSNKGVVTVNSNGQVRVVNCGTAEITIKASAATGYFATAKKITIQVIPSKPSLRTVKSPAKKIITAKWKKDKTITGYQFYMSTNKSFKTGTLAREYKSNKTQFKIFGWKSKKTYYLKMRSYKKVGGKKIYSDWSSVKKVKVK